MASTTVCMRLQVPSLASSVLSPQMGMGTRPGIEHFRAGVTLPALVATPVGCPAMKGLVRAQPMWGRINSGAAPRSSWTPPVPAPSNEPELSLREAVMTLLVVAAFLACIVLAAIQFM